MHDEGLPGSGGRFCPRGFTGEFGLGSTDVLGFRVRLSNLASYGYVTAIIAISIILVTAVLWAALRRVKR